MDKNGLSSFLLGLGVGVGIGMLLAPKSGQETREFIKSKTGEGADYLKQRAGESADYLKQRGGEFRQSASEWVDKGKEAIGRQRDNLADAMEAGRQAYRETVNEPPQSPSEAH